MKQILKDVSMFASLEEDELTALAKISQIYDYKEGETLFVVGDISSVLMLLVEGIASVFKHDDKGNEIVISYFKRYELLAEAATLRHTPLPSSARFQTEGKLIKIDLEEFEKLFMMHPGISYAILQSLLNKIELLQQNIHFNIAKKSIDKILHFYRTNPRLSLDLKQYEIASVLGMTPETFSRNLRKLVKEKKLTKVSTGYKIVS
ncbi:Crp/Fnr family transcriptional regulator [Sulfurovum sp.]|uniref:Crp/Fnr family transcriptional regulator n=1 Tax=Sulfurovum sp. TaxID=1969726 RepID=UPI002867C7D3|nr:Crp/Fnr family transcriptional regulator [Sulfurovum sp.]